MRRSFPAGAIVLLLASGPAFAQTASPSPSRGDAMQAALLQPFKGDWDGIKKRGMLRALVVYSRTLYFVDKGQQRGATYEVLKAFQDQLNTQLKTKTFRFQVVFIPVSRDELIPALLDGRGDIAAANLTITPEREGLVDFSLPVREDVTEVVVTGPSGPKVSSVEDLAGKTVHVRRSSSYWDHLDALSKRLVQAGKPPINLVPISEDLEDEDLLEMANAGLIPIVVCDAFTLSFWKDVYTKLSFEPEVAVSSGLAVAWMMRKDSRQLKAVVNDFILKHRKGTAFGNELLRKYQKGARSVLPATAGTEMRKFNDTVDFFRKYGSKYEVDYLLVMAQGYQESRLDQKVKSPVGALGVMQLMPATGEQMKVGDIHEIEPNIHAGVKYLRWVEDTYFDEPALDPVVRALFSFASYNAGPNRIQTLRKEAAKRGLDPNRWFKNVEYVVGEKIGQETVTYVSNIFKYYVAYQLVSEAQEERKRAIEQMEGGRP